MDDGGNLIWWIIAAVIAFGMIALTLKQRSSRSGSRRRHHVDHEPSDTHKISPEQPDEPIGGLTPKVEAEIRAQMRAGRKINAIKLYREATGLGLKESKDAVEQEFG